MAVRQIEPIDRAELRATIQKWIDAHTDVDDTDGVGLLEDVLWEINAQPTLTPPPITGDTSDGYHTFNELYHHRAVLFSVVCNERPDIAWKSKRHHDGTMYNGMFIVGINTPEGQATYHYDIDPYWELFHVKELEYAPEWDGHTPDEAIRRIGTLTPPNEWISVEDRLPEGHMQVLMWSAKWGIAEAGSYYNSRFWVYNELGDGYVGDRITHWMPLPAPPNRRPPEGEEDT